MHSRWYRWTSILVLPLVLSWVLEPAVAAESQSEAKSLGWHGEPMPEGLIRGAREGEYLWPKDASIMVYVPPGPFPMGSEDGHPDERPVRQVHLDGYYIDKYEVSWGQWKRSGLPLSKNTESRLAEPRPPDWGVIDNQPAVNVSWLDAQAFVEWAGKRLPSEAEWEKAARGTDGRAYPWGDEPPSFERAVWKEHPLSGTSTAAVDCCAAGVSPYGVYNLAGNVYEWCADVYRRDFYADAPARNPFYPGPGANRVLRGGAFVLESEHLRSAARYRLRELDRTPYIGFRAALSGATATERD